MRSSATEESEDELEEDEDKEEVAEGEEAEEDERHFFHPNIVHRGFSDSLQKCQLHNRAQLILTDPPFGVLKGVKHDQFDDKDIRVKPALTHICVILECLVTHVLHLCL